MKSSVVTAEMSEQTQTISQRLAQAIEADIVNGAIPPGTELDERTVAERFGVSRTPVREALRRLAADGLIEVRPRRKAIVHTLDTQRLAQMFEVLASLEALAAECAARRMTEKQVSQLRELHGEIGRAVNERDGEGYDELNHAFHRAIYAGASNTYLQDQVDLLRQRLSPYRRWLLRKLNRMRQSHLEHAMILEAIEQGDGERAAHEMRRHVKDGDRFVDFLISDPDHFRRMAT